MIDAEKLLLETAKDLLNDVTKPTEYSLVKASGLLRLLLLDDYPLIDRANRHHRLRIRFAVGSLQPFSASRGGFIMRGFGPKSPGQFVQATRHQFLGCNCLALSGEVFSVADIIKTTAHKRGGVHVDDSLKDSKDRALFAAMKGEILCGFRDGQEKVDPVLAMIVEIARTTLLAIQPLNMAIAKQGKIKS